MTRIIARIRYRCSIKKYVTSQTFLFGHLNQPGPLIFWLSASCISCQRSVFSMCCHSNIETCYSSRYIIYCSNKVNHTWNLPTFGMLALLSQIKNTSELMISKVEILFQDEFGQQSNVQQQNHNWLFSSLSIIFRASASVKSTRSFFVVNQTGIAHRTPALSFLTPWRHSSPAQNPTRRPHFGLAPASAYLPLLSAKKTSPPFET